MSRPAHLPLAIRELLSTHHLVSVRQLRDLLLQRDGISYNKTSIYRALEKLRSEDALCEHLLPDGETRFELRADHHDHLVCTRCGKIAVTDCRAALPPSIDGFITGHHHLTVFGTCAECAARPDLPNFRS